ncbi:MAG: Sua5 family C-terminal domain-containing protein, partial [Clostridia bacterium]
VMDDMNGKIPAIVDGGECEVGLESTIVDMTCIPPRLLRPGGISLRALRDVLGEIEIDDAVLHELAPGTVVRAPGMKYRHYAPKAPVVILDGATDAAAQYVKEHCDGGKTAILCFSEECEAFADCGAVVVPYGSADNTEELAHRLFFELRQLDEACVDKIFAREPKASDGLELAVINRLQKAAGFLRVTL